MSKPLIFSKHPKHNDYCTPDFLFGNKENVFHQERCKSIISWVGIWRSYLLWFSFICVGFYFGVWLYSLYLHCCVVLNVCRFTGSSEITHESKEQTVSIHILKFSFISVLMY